MRDPVDGRPPPKATEPDLDIIAIFDIGDRQPCINDIIALVVPLARVTKVRIPLAFHVLAIPFERVLFAFPFLLARLLLFLALVPRILEMRISDS